MSAIISFSVNLSKIDKSKVVPGKNGAAYYPMTVFVNDQVDQYGNNVTVSTGWTKEEREAGKKNDYLANGKVISVNGAVTPAPKQGQPTQAPQQAAVPADDFPF
jgi:hypothetical protein